MRPSPHRKSHRRRLLASAIFFGATAAFAAIDPYAALDRAVDRKKLPRLLSTADLNVENPNPEAIRPVYGDFDVDGSTDAAFSGVFIVPGKSDPYFLAVIGDAGGEPRLLHLQTSKKPVYLHAPGMTGPGDPANQAFSISTCVNCSTGTDFRWDPSSKKFQTSAWAPQVRRPAPPLPARQVSPAQVDNALRLAGALPDVQHFVIDVKNRGQRLGSRVEPVSDSNNVNVLIFEKTAKGEKLYDVIEVDTGEGRIVRRRRAG